MYKLYITIGLLILSVIVIDSIIDEDKKEVDISTKGDVIKINSMESIELKNSLTKEKIIPLVHPKIIVKKDKNSSLSNNLKIVHINKDEIIKKNIPIEDKSKLLKLAEEYIDSDEDRRKQIENMNNLELYATIAIKSYNQGDIEIYNKMVQKLIRTDDRKVIDSLMLLANRVEFDSFDEISKVAKEWTKKSFPQINRYIAEDYLSKGNTTAKERIIAVAMLSNHPDKQIRNRILDKALNYEEDESVSEYINNSL